MNNGQNNMFSIGEIAKAVGITRKIILNYEAKGIIRPDKKDGATGNRYYTIDTFTKIRTIRFFQDLGFSLDEIREYLDDNSDVLSLIRKLEKIRDDLNQKIEKLYERASINPNSVREITIAPQTVYCRTYNSSSIAEKTIILRETALEAMRKYGTDITKRMYFIEYGLGKMNGVSYCVAVPPDSEGEYIQKFNTIRAVAMYHHGAYEEISAVREKIINFAKASNLKLSGRCRHLYLEGPPQHKDKSKFITQIILPISE